MSGNTQAVIRVFYCYAPADKFCGVPLNKIRRHRLAFLGEQAAGRSTGNASGSLFSQSSHDKLALVLLPVVKTLTDYVTKYQTLRLYSGANLRTQVVRSMPFYSRRLNRLLNIPYRPLRRHIAQKNVRLPKVMSLSGDHTP